MNASRHAHRLLSILSSLLTLTVFTFNSVAKKKSAEPETRARLPALNRQSPHNNDSLFMEQFEPLILYQILACCCSTFAISRNLLLVLLMNNHDSTQPHPVVCNSDRRGVSARMGMCSEHRGKQVPLDSQVCGGLSRHEWWWPAPILTPCFWEAKNVCLGFFFFNSERLPKN